MDETNEFCSIVDTMANAFTSTRQALQSLHSDSQLLNTSDGISLLSMKHQLLVSYLRSLVLLSARRAIGHTLQTRSSQPTQPFSALSREIRDDSAGDLIDSIIENRVVLEKVQALEGRIRYQIEKLVRLTEAPEKKDAIDHDPLAFRPNPQNFITDTHDSNSHGSVSQTRKTDDRLDTSDRIYHPPRMAPMPYTEKSKNQARREQAPIPSALALLTADPSRPHTQTTTGLSGTPSLASGRAAYLKRLKDFEEENFSRIIMKKSDAKRRARDEQDLALGGDLAGRSNSRGGAGGLADEFGDVLRSVDRVARNHSQSQGDGYDELREKGRKGHVLERSRQNRATRTREEAFQENDVGELRRSKKRGRFELETKIVKKKMTKQRK